MPKIVKYHNKMNSLNFEKFTSNDFDFFFGICHEMQGKGTQEVILSFSYIAQLVNYKETDKKRFIRDIERMYDKVESIQYRYEDDERIRKFRLFEELEIVKEEELVKIQVKKDFVPLLNNLTEQFTLFELQQFITLSGKHSKTLFRICKQWRTTGKTQLYLVEDLKKLFDCENYQSRDFTKLLNKAIEELKEKHIFENLSCNQEKAKKKGSPVVGYTFTFEPEQIIHKAIEQQTEPKKATKKEPSQKPTTHMTKSAEAYNNYPQRQYSKDELLELETKLLALAAQGE